MTDRPIIFSAPMVRALLVGRKIQTRRLATSPLRRVEVGDRLYVREAWRTHRVSDELKPSMLTGEGRVWFEADRDNCDQHGRLRPGMHMPRWASRVTLIVEAVRFQQLGEMMEADAIEEGIYCERQQGWTSDGAAWWASPKIAFHQLWNSIHDKPRERWDDNPEIVALTFRVIDQNIDGIAA